MSIRAKRGTTAQINAAAAQNGLKLSELIYDTDKGSLEVATGAGSRQALMKEAFATQAQAEAGTDNTLPMTPLRTAQAIAAKRGAANGLAGLGADGKVETSALDLNYGAIGTYVSAASTELDATSTVYTPGITVSGSSLLHSNISGAPDLISQSGVQTTTAQVSVNSSGAVFNLGLVGAWRLMSRVRTGNNINFRPIGLFVRIA